MKKNDTNAPKRNNRQALKGGAYSLIITAVVLAILVAVNIFASELPATAMKLDISSAKLYSVTSNTKAVVNNLQDDMTIYWIVQSDAEDDNMGSILGRLLDKYDSLSDHISVVKRNPDVYPTFAQQYTDGDIQNNSLVVECGDRNRYIPVTDIFVQDVDMYSYSYTTSFDGEGAITSAIDYVTSDDLPVVCLLQGHGESDLPAGFAETLEKENIQTQQLTLATADEIPQEADAVMIYAPQSDIGPEEQTMLASYVHDGGKLLVLAGPVDGVEFTNLNALIADYSVTPAEGLVVEGDREHFYFQTPLMLLPDLGDSDITAPLAEDRYYALMPLAQGLTTTGNVNGTVTALLTTSELAYSMPDGWTRETYEKQDSDIPGPFALAVDIEDQAGGEIIWFGCSLFLDDQFNAASSGANANLTMNALARLVGEREAMAIRAKSLNYNYLTISESASGVLKTVMIGVFPLLFLGVGIAVVIRRRRLTNETV